MGFFKVENFDNSYDWFTSSINGGFINIVDNDFEHLQEYEDKKSSLQVSFDAAYGYENTTISKLYYTPSFFKFKDIYGKFVYYDTLRITYKASGDSKGCGYNKPEEFYFSMGIKIRGEVVREWFMPFATSCDYDYTDIDLSPLFEDFDSFDEMYINVLRHPGNFRIIFGSMYLIQDKDEIHNIKLALADLLHLKHKIFLTNLDDSTKVGDKNLKIVGSADVNKGTTILIGEGAISEVHTIRSVDRINTDSAVLELMDEFDSNEIQYTWPNRTPVQRVIPASIIEMRDAEAVFPLYFIYSEFFTNSEEYMNSGIILDSYVKDPDGNHKVAIRKAWDAVSVNMTINVFSDTPETALDMWRFLKSMITSRDNLNVAGRNHQFVITGERDISPEDSEILPNYIMDLTFYFRNNVYNRKYLDYPRFKNLAITYEIKPVEAIK